MTREEAIKILVRAQRGLVATALSEYEHKMIEALEMALSTLRGPTREQAEKVFSGCPACNDRRCTSCWCFGRYEEVCRKCENQSGYQPLKFCPHCGKPLRDEAVQMVVERMEALWDE